MTIFGIREAAGAPLIRALSERDLPSSAMIERFARAIFTGITEPGDRIAGTIIDVLGVTEALTAVLERWSPERLLSAIVDYTEVSCEELAAAQARWQPRVHSLDVLSPLKQAVRFGARLIVPGDQEWPVGVDDLGVHRPIALWMRGNMAALGSVRRSIALVGARAATGYGEHITMEASAGLVDRGYAITSGAAYGIDGMAHRAALASSGQTIAFLAGGVDRFYPSGHDALLTRIVAEGAVVSELPCGAPPTKWRFLQRNRLIAASSLATIVLEAGWRSGSLNTAGHAAALGRPLGAVPGPVTSAASAGCHRLIRDFDAVCVTSASEMAELAPLDSTDPEEDKLDEGRAEAGPEPTMESARTTRVIDALSVRAGRSTENIAARAGLAIAEVQSVLGVLEIEEKVKENSMGWVIKRG